MPGTGYQKLKVNEELTNLRNADHPGRIWEPLKPGPTPLACGALWLCTLLRTVNLGFLLYILHSPSGLRNAPGYFLQKENEILFGVSPLFKSFKNEKKARYLTGEM